MKAYRLSIALNIVLATALAAIGARWLLRRADDSWATMHMEATRDMHEKLSLPPSSIVLLGDSLTQYGAWAELLGRHDVYNRGIAGDTAPLVRARLESIVRAEPKVVVLLVGINDLSSGRRPGEVVADIDAIVTAVRDGSPRTRLVVQSVLPVRSVAGRHAVSPDLIAETNRGLESLCKQRGAEYLDVWTALADGERMLGSGFTVDGVHLNGSGYQRWASVLGPALR